MTAALPFNVAVSLAFHLIYYGMAGLRHGAPYVARSALLAVLLGLTATQARGRGGGGGWAGAGAAGPAAQMEW